MNQKRKLKYFLGIVLIVAKCIVNIKAESVDTDSGVVLIVAKCIVNYNCL